MMRKFALFVASAATAVFLLGMVLPLAVDRALVTVQPFKSYWGSFLLKDQHGRRHVGFLAFGNVIYNADFFEYGYEAPPGKDLSKWVKRITDVDRDEIENIDGFIWSSKGFLWGDSQHFGPEVRMQEASRIGLGRKLGDREQTELTLPGAPWDVKTANQSFLGTFPHYRYEFEDDNFKLDLMLTAKQPQWVMWNSGAPFATGDFGKGSMNELTGDLVGTIVHKKTGESFEVSGQGLIEDAVGVPWSWVEWGGHDYNDLHFEGGWQGSLWVAHDDWQWGRHPDPRLGWIWDPERGKVHHFRRTEMVEMEMTTDELSGIEYPVRSVWRGYAEDATIEIENVSRTFKPRETVLPVLGISLKMGYGNNAVTGRVIRRDGSVVELEDGIGTMEHFAKVIPDYAGIGPSILVLLVLSWCFYWAVVRRQDGQGIAPPLASAGAGLLAVIGLCVAWM